jgi:glycosyltransferase involved in cell wall biosynthesis
VARTHPDVTVIQYVPHAYSPRGGGLPFSALVALAMRPIGVPTVVNAHELAGDLRGHARRIPWHVSQRVAVAVLMLASDKLVVTVEKRRTWLRRYFLGAKHKVSTIPIGSTLAGIRTDATTTETPSTPPSRTGTRMRLGSMGMGHPTQQIGDLTHMLDLLEGEHVDVELAVAGHLNVPDPRVRHLGYLDDADLLAFLRSLDLFVLPISDGFSGRRSAPISALEVGTPVLTTWGSETDLHAYPIDDLALVAAGDADGLARTALRLLTTPGALDEVRDHWHKVFARDLSWPVVARAWSDLLTSLAEPDTSSIHQRIDKTGWRRRRTDSSSGYGMTSTPEEI